MNSRTYIPLTTGIHLTSARIKNVVTPPQMMTGRNSPKLLTKDTLFHCNNTYIGQEDPDSVQGGKARDIAEGYSGGSEATGRR